MIIDYEHLLTIFQKIRNIKEHHKQYLLNADRVPVSVDDLVWVACDMYGFSVKRKKVLAELIIVRGNLLRFEGTPENPHVILVRGGQSPFWLRYVVTKELSHLIVDEREDWCPDANIIIDELFKLFQLEQENNGKTEPNRRVISEHVAEVVAIELLYPYECRAADKAALAANETGYEQLEKRYEIPAAMISRALTPWYQSMCHTFWTALSN